VKVHTHLVQPVQAGPPCNDFVGGNILLQLGLVGLVTNELLLLVALEAGEEIGHLIRALFFVLSINLRHLRALLPIEVLSGPVALPLVAVFAEHLFSR